MAELEIDQSNLPRVQEVRQCFAVLEDGVLAHNLQEQEIEHYYTTNIQKNQLVQNDIRVAKRLQDEEEEQRARQTASFRHASRQIEEEDFEYARVIQEEIQRCAEEAWRREQDDQELAKQMQEEEEQIVRRRSRGQEAHGEGSLLQPELSNTSLDLGELQQVLEDEELARKLQEEEEDSVLRRNSNPPPSRSYPEGDFRVAQVAQDEEIARFMQKQEIKAKRQSRELEGPSSWREHRAMISQHDRRAGRERHVPRERLDSEGLPSPTEDCSPENQPPSPISTLPPASQIRNIAEELDPTFQARRQGTDRPTGPNSLPPSQSGSNDFVEEPTFIPPTKRQADKSGRNKPKDKKENCKQQ
ncbi:coiled-coil domain-containing protein 187 isoform X2 [Salarias fasciatus]|uniref:coiled-coil domain-containing protein 187 isoform X2 n=1 Tax=Salarias fasciatus TaxID=181472 RepID=UPI0011768D87|nr:coiled-coil domain-containing protein 50-like isoform X2 [Salarias fasciatus]